MTFLPIFWSVILLTTAISNTSVAQGLQSTALHTGNDKLVPMKTTRRMTPILWIHWRKLLHYMWWVLHSCRKVSHSPHSLLVFRLLRFSMFLSMTELCYTLVPIHTKLEKSSSWFQENRSKTGNTVCILDQHWATQSQKSITDTFIIQT